LPIVGHAVPARPVFHDARTSPCTDLVAPGGSADRSTARPHRPNKEKPSDLEGFSEERLKGLEPSTFCMASRRSSQLSYSRADGEYSSGGFEFLGELLGRRVRNSRALDPFILHVDISSAESPCRHSVGDRGTQCGFGRGGESPHVRRSVIGSREPDS
jgi:hypothetical protein